MGRERGSVVGGMEAGSAHISKDVSQENGELSSGTLYTNESKKGKSEKVYRKKCCSVLRRKGGCQRGKLWGKFLT